MRAKGRTAQWRSLALLTVLVGLLAMHGLGGALHHAPPAPAATSTTGPTQQAGHAVAEAGHTVHGAVAATGDRLSAACHDACPQPGAAALCLAVLTAAAFALAAAAQARARRIAFAVTGWRVRPLRAPPLRFDLVADLCVSRT